MNNKNPMNQTNSMNENKDINKDIKSSVLEQIQTGKINMRPHFHFVLGVVSLIIVAVLTLLISSLLISFIIFSLVASGKLFLFGFGMRGFLMFFLLFPWFLLIFEIILIALLEWLIKKFKFGYRSSLSRLVFVILLASIAIGVIIVITPFHSSIQQRAEQRNLPIPFVGDFYRGIRRPPPGQEIFRGIVTDVGTSSFILNQKGNDGDNDANDLQNQKYVITLPLGVPKIIIPTVGDTVFVAGKLMPDNTVQAYGFQKFSSGDIR
jgi:hypothetical protein